MYNLLIGGAAGQGIDTIAAILEKLLKKSGYSVFTVRDFMSRIRGGHNFSLIRFGTEELLAHSTELDGIIALNQETIELHLAELKKDGFILCDSSFVSADPRSIKINMSKLAKESTLFWFMLRVDIVILFVVRFFSVIHASIKSPNTKFPERIK